MRPLVPAVLVAALLATPALAALAPRTSWGKPNVSLADYRADSLACGRDAYYLDISGTDQAKAFVTASRRINGLFEDAGNTGAGAGVADDAVGGQVLDSYITAQQAAEGIDPRRKVAELRRIMADRLAACLTGRGYHRFRLTDDQRRRLSHMGAGSDARRAYLHGLASDPQVLAAQVE